MDLPQPSLQDSNLIPPRDLLHDGSSSPEEFVLLGENFVNYILIPRAQLLPTASILDLGCGNGAVGRALTRYLKPPGRYDGVDVNATSIAWLKEHYQTYTNFNFTHTNVWNRVYNPGGQLDAGAYRLPFANSTFDLVLLKSVFTHMLPDDVRSYLSEVARVLKPEGRSVITYFLLNDESRRFIDRALDAHKLAYEYAKDPFCRIANPDMPESVVAHEERRIRDWYGDVGCTLLELVFGDWCGRRSLLGHQDLVIAVRTPGQVG